MDGLVINKRNRKYKEKCPICKKDYSECYINHPFYGMISISHVPPVIKIGKLKMCLTCFEKIAYEILDEDILQFFVLKKLDERKNSEIKNYKKELVSNKLRWEVFKEDNFTCLKCKTRDNLTIDHIIPESKGGKTEKKNLQTLCKKCNSEKGIKIINYKILK